MYLPEIHDERTTLTNFLEVQLDALRASAHGLTDEQARQAPFRSVFSISGILKHCTFVMKQRLVAAGRMEADESMQDFYGSFTPSAEQSLERLLAAFDETSQAYLSMCHEGDPDAEIPVGPMPWFGMNEQRAAKLRYVYCHNIEEFARHAGHADLIREQIDGAKAAELLLAVEGLPANDYVTPWQRGAAES